MFGNSEALSIFDLRRGASSISYSSEDFVDKVNTIARVTNVSSSTLRAQFEDIHPRAVAHASMSSGSADNKCAWKAVIDKIGAHRAVAQAHPTDCLQKALVLHNVLGISSSGVEQGFAQSAWGFGDRRQHAGEDTEEFCVRGLLELRHHDKRVVIEKARAVWGFCFGDVRASGTRISKGVKRSRVELVDGCLPTEKAFIAERRKAIKAVSRNGHVDLNADALMASADCGANAVAGWGESHRKELEFQRSKLHN